MLMYYLDSEIHYTFDFTKPRVRVRCGDGKFHSLAKFDIAQYVKPINYWVYFSLLHGASLRDYSRYRSTLREALAKREFSNVSIWI